MTWYRPALRKDFVILQLYWWLFSSTKYGLMCGNFTVIFFHHVICNRSAIHTMTVELYYKLHSKLMPVICTVK